MTRAKAERMWRTTLLVYVGGGSIPLDMMRFDRCMPATEMESGKLERIGDHRAESTAERVVRFYRVSLTNAPAETARWRSFGCEVLCEWNGWEEDVDRMRDAVSYMDRRLSATRQRTGA